MMTRAWRIVSSVALILAASSTLLSALLFSKVHDEGQGRRSQTCTLFEGQQRKTIVGLYRTYHYLEGLSAKERLSPLNMAIVEGLPQAEADARVPVPSYCDDKGIGLKEPSHPPIPERPRGL